MTKAERLDDLRPKVLACRACGLRDAATQVVFGEGSPNARLVFIGEGPGADEDRLGRPFVGRAGQLLDRMIAAMGMTRFDDVYILNVVKCRPPGNRTPTPEEWTTCRPHLEQQLDILDPAIIVLLGSTALKALIDPTLRITQMRGQWIERGGRWWMPTYHPAALLRNPSLKRETWEDLKRVLDKYRELVNPRHESPHYPIISH
ncbi:MAG: uracil-DNA glycosylase [Firmicutes bacterium]|nr:uracil-DNA glycosylase [Bacillota bacterium]